MYIYIYLIESEEKRWFVSLKNYRVPFQASPLFFPKVELFQSSHASLHPLDEQFRSQLLQPQRRTVRVRKDFEFVDSNGIILIRFDIHEFQRPIVDK